MSVSFHRWCIPRFLTLASCGVAAALVTAATAPGAQQDQAQHLKDLEKRLAAASEKEQIAILDELALAKVRRAPQPAIELARSALALAQRYGDQRGEALAEKAIGLGLMVLERDDEALASMQKAHDLFEKLGDRRETGSTLGYGAMMLENTGKLTPAIETARQALAIFRELHDDKGIAAATNNLGVMYLKVGDAQQALRYNLEALEVEEKLGRKLGIANNLNSIGNITSSLGEQEKARGYYERALSLFTELGERNAVGKMLNNIGITYEKRDADEEALRYHRRALAVAREIGSLSDEADDRNNIAIIEKKQGHLDEALAQDRAVRDIYLRLDDVLSRTWSEHNIAEVLYLQKQYQAARSTLVEALALAQKTGSKSALESIYRLLAEVEHASGDDRKAYEYSRLYAETREAMLDEARNKKIAELQERYQADARKSQIAILTRDNELLKKDGEIRRLALTRTRLVAALAVALAALVLGGAALLLRRYLYLLAFWRRRSHIGHYRILDTLGSGGMGVVYRAADLLDRSRVVAVKVIREEHAEDAVLRRRFLNEAALVDRLDHPNIVKVIERGETNRQLFMAMEFLEGTTLAALVARRETLPLARCLHVMLQLAAAVRKVHERGIVHRDLKPENVMLVQRDGDRDFVKLLDFGLARADALTRLTETGMIVGSINYVAPEQISDHTFTAASDIYSLGVTFFELVTLEKPFLGEGPADVIRQVLEKAPIAPTALRPDLPPRLDRLILAMLAKRPGERPTGGEVADVLGVASDETVLAPPPMATVAP